VPSVDRGAHPAKATKAQSGLQWPGAECLESWQFVFHFRLASKFSREFPNNLNSNERAGCELGYSGRSCNTIIQHQQTIRPFINPRRRHSRRGAPEQGNLPHKLLRIGTFWPRRRQTKFGRIDIAKFNHASNVSIVRGRCDLFKQSLTLTLPPPLLESTVES